MVGRSSLPIVPLLFMTSRILSSSLNSLNRSSRLLKTRPPPLLYQRRLYHDDEVYGYRVAKEFKMPDYTSSELANRVDNGSLLRMVQAYRTYGHKSAHLDPLDIMEHE